MTVSAFPIVVAGPVDHQRAFTEQLMPMLRAELGEDVFTSWFGRLQLDGIAGDVARLSVPTKFLCSWLQQHYVEKIKPIFADVFPAVTRLVIGVRTQAVRPSPVLPFRSPADVARPRPTIDDINLPKVGEKRTEEVAFEGSRIDPRHTFETFIAGSSNRQAFAACQSIAAADALYKNVFVHGEVGLGKTHLLQATAAAAKEAGLRALYMTAERFMYGFAVALKAQTIYEFKQRLRGFDLLLLDDVQFLQGKSVQTEFTRTVDAILDNGGRLIVAGDLPPNDMDGLEPRSRSRLAAGLAATVEAPDQDLRVALLRAGIERKHVSGFDVSTPVIERVATLIQTNGRDLEGAVNRLLSAWYLTKQALTAETAALAVRDLIREREPRKVKIEEIQKLCADHFNVTRHDIMSSRRTQNVVRPRQVAMYLSKVMTLRSLPEIGRRFGGRDHTTVLHAVRKIESLVAKQEEGLHEDVRIIRTLLEAR